jgi:hypothetical protein
MFGGIVAVADEDFGVVHVISLKEATNQTAWNDFYFITFSMS